MSCLDNLSKMRKKRVARRFVRDLSAGKISLEDLPKRIAELGKAGYKVSAPNNPAGWMLAMRMHGGVSKRSTDAVCKTAGP